MSKQIRRAAIAALMIVVLTVPLAAADAPEGEPAPMTLGIRQAVVRALEENLDVALARTEPRTSELNVLLGQAAFDPSLSASVDHAEEKGEPAVSFGTTKSTTDQAAVTVAGLLPTGLSYDATLFHRDRSEELASAFFQLVPDTQWSGMTVNLRHPLLQGFGPEMNRSDIVVAQRNLEISESQLAGRLLDTVQEVESAYWDLVTARGNLTVAQKSLQRAREFYELNRTKVEVGTLAPIEITTAEAEVAEREEALIRAEKTIRDAEDALRALMNVDRDSTEWERTILPADEPELRPVQVDLEQALARAMDHRVDLDQARIGLRVREIESRKARDGIRHQLDLVASYTSRGNNFDEMESYYDVDGDGTKETVSLTTLQSRSESFKEILDAVNQDWSVGLEWTYSLNNRTSLADYSKKRIAQDQARLNLQKTEQAVRLDVRRAVRALETDAKRVEAARASVHLQEKKVEAEQKKYENGMSTSFEVLTFQQDLAQAESRLIQALSDYNKSLTGLAHATGTLLEERDIRFEPARYGRDLLNPHGEIDG